MSLCPHLTIRCSESALLLHMYLEGTLEVYSFSLILSVDWLTSPGALLTGSLSTTISLPLLIPGHDWYPSLQTGSSSIRYSPCAQAACKEVELRPAVLFKQQGGGGMKGIPSTPMLPRCSCSSLAMSLTLPSVALSSPCNFHP